MTIFEFLNSGTIELGPLKAQGAGVIVVGLVAAFAISKVGPQMIKAIRRKWLAKDATANGAVDPDS